MASSSSGPVGDRCGERRRSRRLRTRLRAYYCPLFHGVELVQVRGARQAVVTDVSARGVFLAGAPELRVGTLLHLFLRLPDLPATEVSCLGRVARRHESLAGGAGVQLLRVRTCDAARLHRFLDSLQGRVAEPLTAAITLELEEEDLLSTIEPPPIIPGITFELSEDDLEELEDVAA